MFSAFQRWIRLVPLAFGLVIACQPTGWQEPCPQGTPWLKPPRLGSVAESLVVDGSIYTLECYLWRDFMPVAPRNGDPLRAVIRLIRTDSLAIPDGTDLTHLWIILDQGFWSTDYNDEQLPPTPRYQLERIARCGPKWGPGITVDVVTSVHIGELPNTYLKAIDVPIGRTD